MLRVHSYRHKREMWNNLVVKRYFVFLLILWMPLQVSLAAFEELRAHHEHTAAHASHESVESENAPAAFADTQQSECNNECHTHHFCMAQLLCPSASTSVAPYANSSSYAFSRGNTIAQRSSERPERPQWSTSSF